MKYKQKKTQLFILFLILAGALLLRVILIGWTLNYGNNGDFTRYEDWTRIAHAHGLAATYTGKYSTTVANNEPPGTLYVMSSAYEFYILEGRLIARMTLTAPGSSLWVNTYLQTITMKLPSLLADMCMGILIFLIVSKISNTKKGLLAASLFLFNPIVLYNSAIWGQMDAINNFFFILSLFFAYRRKIFLAILFYFISLYIKFSLLPLLPFYFVFLYFFSGKKLRTIIFSIVISSVVIIIVTYPFSSNPFMWLITKMPVLTGGELQNISIAAFNFWMLVTCLPSICSKGITPPISQEFLGITFNMWGYILFAIFMLPLVFLQIKRQNMIESKNSLFIFSLVALFTFLVLPKMHDRYLYPFFPLFAMSIALSEPKKLWIWFYVILSLLHFDNVVYSWFPIVFSSTTLFYHIFYGPILRWIMSLLTVVTGLTLYVLSLRKFGFNAKLFRDWIT